MIFAKTTIVSLLVTAALLGGVASFAEEGDLMLDQVSLPSEIVDLKIGVCSLILVPRVAYQTVVGIC
jgi:hypothetical protein